MKMAISSERKDIDSEVSLRGGRAPFYLIFEENKLVKVLKNPFKMGGGGAGFGVAEMLADEKVDLVITGKIGNNMKGALESKNIKYKEMQNITIKETLEKVENA